MFVEEQSIPLAPKEVNIWIDEEEILKMQKQTLFM